MSARYTARPVMLMFKAIHDRRYVNIELPDAHRSTVLMTIPCFSKHFVCLGEEPFEDPPISQFLSLVGKNVVLMPDSAGQMPRNQILLCFGKTDNTGLCEIFVHNEIYSKMCDIPEGAIVE